MRPVGRHYRRNGRFAGIPDAVGVGVRLVRVGNGRAVVVAPGGGAASAGMVAADAAGVAVVQDAVVVVVGIARVAQAVGVGVFLARVGHSRAVVARVPVRVAVEIGLRRI